MMRFLLSLLVVFPLMASAQLCSEPSPVSYAGFGPQLTQVDYFPDADYLDELNNSAAWSIGSGISDNNLCVLENADITTFLGVKLRNAVAPDDNPASSDNVYFVEPGYSPASLDGSTGSGPEAKWNILMYADIANGAFDSVEVVLHIDFDPCFGYTGADMLTINIGESFDSNPFTQAEDFSSFGINSNLGSTEIANLNPAGTGFDATIEGYYTFAIEVLNNCGVRKAWNEVTVYVQSTTTDGGSAVADADNNGVYDDNETVGCQNEAACNYDCNATTNSGCTYIAAGWDDCDQTICTDSDNDGICDFDEPIGCVGDFNEPHLSLSGVVETDLAVAEWASADFAGAASDDTGVEETTYVDYTGRLSDGRYSMTRVYTTTDICANSSEAAQLIIADDTHPAGCTNPNATSFDPAAINDDGTCNYSPACLGDLNLDNVVGTTDLLILLSTFSLPCSE